MNGLYAQGGALGISPAEVDRLSLWQFQAMLGGFIVANSAGKPQPLTPEDAQRLGDFITSTRH